MEFVPFELSKKLKEKGYPQVKKNTLAMYDEDGEWYSLAATIDEAYSFEDFDKHDCVCPIISQVLKWLREEKKIHFEFVAAAYGYNVIISQTPEAGGTDYYYTHMNDDGPNDGGAWDRYEDAALYCIEYVIDNLI